MDLLIPSPRHLDIALGLLQDLGTAGNLTTDAQLAAHALEHPHKLARLGKAMHLSRTY